MSEIPRDIPSDVVALARKYSMNDDVLVAVCRAIMAERERCANICDSRMYDFGCISGTEAQDYVTICADLACEIRGINNS